jgi:hypothetical protein
MHRAVWDQLTGKTKLDESSAQRVVSPFVDEKDVGVLHVELDNRERK